MKKSSKSIAAVVACLAVTIGVCRATTANFPDRPVKVLVGFSAGSGPDVIARAVAAQLTEDLHQPFIVQNLPGANGTIAIKYVVNAPADGYTLLYSSSSITPVPYVYKNLGFDILKDLLPVATSGILDGDFMLVNPSFPANNVREFIDYAKAHRVLYGSPGIGNGLHLAAEMFNVKARLTMEHVPFKGASDVVNGLLNGSIQMMFVTPPSVLPLVQSGLVKAIGFAGSKPFPQAPSVPLIRDTLPDYPVEGSWGMFYAPKNAPDAVINALNGAIRKSLNEPAVSKVVGASGYVPDERSPAETEVFFRSEVEAAGEAVRAAKIIPE